MQLGIYLDMRNPPGWPAPWAGLYRDTIDLVVDAERRGAHAVWLTEHHGFEDGYLSQPLALSATCSGWRSGASSTAVPIRIERVRTARAAARASGCDR